MTQLLAQLIGPAMILMALGLYVDSGRYKRMMQGMKPDSLSLFLTGILTFVVGLVMIRAHSLWNTLPEVIVSLFGWMAMLKGVWIVLSPKSGIKTGMQCINNTSAIGFVAVLIGAYLSWVGYFIV